MIYDTFFSTLGSRGERPYDRLWIEDQAGRLTRNGFVAGSTFAINPRPGVGLVLTPALAGYAVTPRRGGSVLSYEARGLADKLTTRELRIRVCVKSIVVVPVLRQFHIRKATDETWTITGSRLFIGQESMPIDSAGPQHFARTPARIEMHVTADNVVFATEIIGNVRPSSVVLKGDYLMTTACEPFLAAAGYTPAAAGIWQR